MRSKMKEQIPIRFFAVTFLWTWAFWSPFVLAGIGVYELDEGISSIAAMPAAYLGAFGPAVGALYSVWTLKGKGAVIVFLKSFLSLRFGWTAWVAIFAVLGLVNFAAWYIPELFGYERLPMLLPSIFVFPVWWLLMLFLGGGQEEIGWRGYILSPLESRFGLVGGNIVLG